MSNNMDNDELIKEMIDSGQLVILPEKGEVYSHLSWRRGKPLGIRLNRKGLARTATRYRGATVYFMIHRAVWIAAHGVPQTASTLIHIDGNGANNCLDNLRLIESLSPRARITRETARNIRSRWEAGETIAALGAEYGLHEAHIYNIGIGKRWPEQPKL